MIKQYVRLSEKGRIVTDENGTQYQQLHRGPRVGVMVALSKDKIGWSLLSGEENLDMRTLEKVEINTPRGKKTVVHGHQFWTAEKIWEYGTKIAEERANGVRPVPEIVPTIIQKNLTKFQKRVNAYFK